MPHRTYQEHLRSTLQGRKEAFNQIVPLFRDMALAMSLRRLKDRGLAEDAVQEAFLTAFRKLSDLNDLNAFPAWFRTIVSSCCHRQERNRSQTVSLERVSDDSLESQIPGPLEVMTRFQDRRMVLETLGALSGPIREACIQRYLHGRSYQDIAVLLGIPLGTLKRRLHDARAVIIRRFNAEQGRSMRIGYLPISDHLLAMVAHQRHDQQDFAILLKRFLTWTSLVLALRNGMVDAALVMAPLAMSLRNQGESLLYILNGHREGSAIAALEHVSSRQSLSCARIGLPHSQSTHAMLLHGLLKACPGSVRQGNGFKYVGPSYLIRSLKCGEIDAFFCAEPWSTKSVREGTGRILIRSKDVLPGHLCCVLVVRSGFAARNGDLTRDCVRGFLAASDFIASDPGSSARIQARYTGIDPVLAEEVLTNRNIAFNDLAPDADSARSTMSMALKAGLLDRPCPIEGFLRTDFV